MNGSVDPGPRSMLMALLTCAITWIGLLPGSAAGAEVRSFGFDGASAAAVFESFEGCMKRSAYVMPVDGRTRDNQTGVTSEATLLVQLVGFNYCSFRQDYRFGQVELAPGDLRVRGNLNSASLSAHVELYDWITGSTVPAQIDLTWRGADAPKTREGYHTRDPSGTMEIYRGVGRMSPAIASGSIWDGSYDWTGGGESMAANIASTRAGLITIVR